MNRRGQNVGLIKYYNCSIASLSIKCKEFYIQRRACSFLRPPVCSYTAGCFGEPDEALLVRTSPYHGRGHHYERTFFFS